MNTCVIVGRVTKDIEMRKTQSGKSVVSFTVAVNRRGQDAGADFIPCVAWNKTAELLARYVHKGDRVGIEGSISTRNYTDNSGQKRYITEVLAHTVEFMQDRKEQTQEAPNQDAYSEYPAGIDDADLPF